MNWSEKNQAPAAESEKLDRLFRAYRTACPDLEPTADFMPGLWRKIESRQTFGMRFRRWTQVLVAASAMACLLMGGYVLSQQAGFAPANYLEVLDDDGDDLFVEAAATETGRQ